MPLADVSSSQSIYITKRPTHCREATLTNRAPTQTQPSADEAQGCVGAPGRPGHRMGCLCGRGAQVSAVSTWYWTYIGKSVHMQVGRYVSTTYICTYIPTSCKHLPTSRAVLPGQKPLLQLHHPIPVGHLRPLSRPSWRGWYWFSGAGTAKFRPTNDRCSTPLGLTGRVAL